MVSFHSNTKESFLVHQNQKSAVDFLRDNAGISTMLSATAHNLELRVQCVAALPSMFSNCEVLQYKNESLTLSISNAALASKLRQQLPRLRNKLLAKNWKISAVQVRVQVQQQSKKAPTISQRKLPSIAFSAFSSLVQGLEPSTSNETLKNAILKMIEHHEDKSIYKSR
jgi:hypothetical protein